MTDFTDLDLNKDVSEMEDGEARETLVDFVEAHQKNRTAYDELQSELDEVETEYKEKLEEKKELISEFKQKRAEKASEYVNIPSNLVAERFEFSEIEQIIEEGSEFADESEDETAEEEEDDELLTTFAEREERGEAGGDTGPSDHARELIHNKW